MNQDPVPVTTRTIDSITSDVTARTQFNGVQLLQNGSELTLEKAKSPDTTKLEYWNSIGCQNEFKRGELYGSMGKEGEGTITEFIGKLNNLIISTLKEHMEQLGINPQNKSAVFAIMKNVSDLIFELEIECGARIHPQHLIATLQGFMNAYVKSCIKP